MSIGRKRSFIRRAIRSTGCSAASSPDSTPAHASARNCRRIALATPVAVAKMEGHVDEAACRRMNSWKDHKMLKGSKVPRDRDSQGRQTRAGALRCIFGVVPFVVPFLGLFFGNAATARAEVQLDGLFSRSAVLQQGMPVPIFGTAEDGERISVAIQDRRAETVAKDGRWRVELEPLEAGGPYELRIGGATSLTVPEIYVGEVWVCAGQANMQWNVFNSKGYTGALISPSNRSLHFFTVERKASNEPKWDNTPNWSAANAATIANFSAVGYYFGRDIQTQRKVPVGLINCSQFMSNAEAWTDRESIAADSELKRIVDDVLPDRQDVQTPGTLYNGMLAPISQYAVRGVIFYQGENNIDRAKEYQRLLTTLIGDWRRAWNKPELPFLFVQIAPFRPVTSSTSESKFAALREAQLLTWQATPQTAMVVTTDCGNARSLQPDEKEPVGRRLALAARAVAYDEKIEYSGPVYRSFKVIKNQLILEFDHVGQGLQAGPPTVSITVGATTKPSTVKPASSTTKAVKLFGFTIAGSDGVFVPAEATIDNNTIVLSAEAVAKPTAARYGWADFPVCNLYNRDGLPASPFRTDVPKEGFDPVNLIQGLFQNKK
ncbi:MAG: hypothetical protein C0483_09055 [Pirellula sp.]|nr:hypothetical protein [Pirellula sp.]